MRCIFIYTHQVLGAALSILLAACWISFAGFVLTSFIYSMLAYSLCTSAQNILTAYYLLITRLIPFNLLTYSPKCSRYHALPPHYLLITCLLPICLLPQSSTHHAYHHISYCVSSPAVPGFSYVSSIYCTCSPHRLSSVTYPCQLTI